MSAYKLLAAEYILAHHKTENGWYLNSVTYISQKHPAWLLNTSESSLISEHDTRNHATVAGV